MRTFAAVAKASSFTKAAERLGISVKLASKYVGQLEDRIGVRLLNRTTRRISLTEVGVAYLERCQFILDEFDNLEAAVHDKQTTPKGLIHITAPVTFGEMHLTPLISGFLQSQPGISINLNLSDRHTDIIDEGFDLAIRIGELSDSSLIAKRLGPVKLVVLATDKYLEKFGTPTHPRQLSGHHCIIDSNFRSGAQWPFQENGNRLPVKISGTFQANSANAVRQIALSHQGIAMSPDYVVNNDIETGKLKTILDDYLPPPLGIYAVYPHSRRLAAKVRVFVDYMAKQLGSRQSLPR